MDSLNILESAKEFPRQCQQVIEDTGMLPPPFEYGLVHNIVISGMGGSALGGRVISYLDRQLLKIPIVVSTEYHLPNFVNSDTLVVISSYSGNTAETLHSLAEARTRGAKIYILSSGGKLAEIAKAEKLPHYIFDPIHNPSGQPRMGLGYGIMALIMLLSKCNLIHQPKDLSKLYPYLESRTEDLSVYEDLARNLTGKIPVLVASEHLKGAIHVFKNQINETAKNFSVIFDIPELNHHLMEGLANPVTNQTDLYFLFINSQHYHPEVKNRYPITEDVIKRQKINYSEICLSGPDRLFEAMELIQLGGFVSYFMSQANGVDPGPIPWVNFFKDAIASNK